MKFWRNLSRRRRAAPVEDSPRLTAADRAGQAEQEKLYSLGEVTTLDGFGLMKALMLHRHRPIAHYLAGVGKRRSMLHADVLLLLYYLARHAPGDVLEIGPYVGGSTIAAAQGIRDSGRTRKFLTVERGGHFAHPKIPSSDIVRDLKQNLATHGVSDLVQVIVGAASTEETKATVRQQLAPGSVGMLVMDADGAVEAALATHRDLLRDPCWVVIDDYYATGMALDKAIRTKDGDRCPRRCGRAGSARSVWLGNVVWPLASDESRDLRINLDKAPPDRALSHRFINLDPAQRSACQLSPFQQQMLLTSSEGGVGMNDSIPRRRAERCVRFAILSLGMTLLAGPLLAGSNSRRTFTHSGGFLAHTRLSHADQSDPLRRHSHRQSADRGRLGE